jgi:tetratricopeptide (TPR) repeat protein
MQRGDVALVAGLAGFLLGAFAAYTAATMKADLDSVINERRVDEDALAGLGNRVDELDKSHKELARRVGGLSSDPKSLRESVERLQGRVTALEQGQAPPKVKDGEPAAPKGAGASEEDFDALQKKVFADQATDDEQARYWALLREKPEVLADLMKKAEKAVADAPRDKESHRRLANVYLAKLMSVPDGMEKGVWSNKMIGEEKAILEIDPGDWDARFSVATNYSFWPEQLNKRPDAIREFETLRKLQEQRTPEPKFAQTYLQLRNLYLKDNRTEDAKAVLEDGLRRFPDDEELQKLK